jgi:hypothetical protein
MVPEPGGMDVVLALTLPIEWRKGSGLSGVPRWSS